MATATWAMPTDLDVPPALRRAVGGHPLVARILADRGILDPERAAGFLDASRYVASPPGEWPHLTAAGDVVRDAIGRGQRIRVWGDADADGITATAVLFEALAASGARVDCRLPGRAEGHGLPVRAVEQAHADGVGLLVTVDTGVGEVAAASRARSLGVHLVVTDHHDPPDRLPDADALVDPKLLPGGHPLRELSGAAVAYLLAVVLLGNGGARGLLDLVAVGLVADLVPLVDGARYLAQLGLQQLRATERPGVVCLLEVAGVDRASADELDIALSIAPRLNAAARLDDATLGVRVLTTNDATEARQLADRLDGLNRQRQARADAALAAAEEQLRRDAELGRGAGVFVRGDTWDGGTLGLVAGALARRYERPAFALSRRPDGTLVASARSVPGVDVHEAIASQRHLLLREGGHPMAAGFSLAEEHLATVKAGILRHLQVAVAKRPPQPRLQIDAVIPPAEVGLPLARELARLAPFGPGNPAPVLVLRAAKVVRVEEDGPRRHGTPVVHVTDAAGKALRVLGFEGAPPAPGAEVDLAVTLRIKHWRGRERLDVRLVDHRPATGMVEPAGPSWLAGMQVEDMRGERDVGAQLAGLRRSYAGELLVWSEGQERPPDAVDRTAIGASAQALAVAWAPPGPQELALVLQRARPGLLVLLPVTVAQEPALSEALKTLARLLGRRLRTPGGAVAAERLAADMGARLSLVEAGLEYLEAIGRVRLQHRGDLLTAVRRADEERPVAGGRDAVRARRALAVIDTLLHETSAYRRAYVVEPLHVLLGGHWGPDRA